MSVDVEKRLKTFQKTSRMKYVASLDGEILFQSNNEDEFAVMRQEYLDSFTNELDDQVAEVEENENSSSL